MGEKIQQFAGDGAAFGLRIDYSQEPEPLETGGGLLKALPLLGDQPFLLINGDVWSDFSLSALQQHLLPNHYEGHLIMVPNPEFHPRGDFSLAGSNELIADEKIAVDQEWPKYTFAGISLLRPELIANYPQKRIKFPLGEVLRNAIANNKLTAEVYAGRWSDVGTPERLHILDADLSVSNVL